MKLANPNASFGEIGKILGQLWVSLDDKAKVKYNKQAAIKRDEVDEIRKIAKKNAPPKRTPTSYLIFCSQARTQVKTTHPTATFAETGKILGAMWASLDERSKAVYTRAAAEQKAAAGL